MRKRSKQFLAFCNPRLQKIRSHAGELDQDKTLASSNGFLALCIVLAPDRRQTECGLDEKIELAAENAMSSQLILFSGSRWKVLKSGSRDFPGDFDVCNA